MGHVSGARVLVTGAGGFIGSHLTEALVGKGARVRALCAYNSRGSAGWLDQAEWSGDQSVDIRLGDIRDARFVEDACRGVDIVFHLAALIAIPYSYIAPASFIETNVGGTLNVLEGVRRHGVHRLVQTSTSEVYGTPKTLPITEHHPLNAQSPYAASKVAADQLALSFHRSFGTPVTVVRPFNTYGPRQSTRAVLPAMLTQLLSGGTEIQLGRLDPRRDLTFVTDTVEGFILAGSTEGAVGEVVQLGTGGSVSVGELFEAACRSLGVAAVVRPDPRRVRPDASEVLTLESCPQRAKQLLGWEARVSLDDGLRRTAEWLRANLHLYRTERFCV